MVILDTSPGASLETPLIPRAAPENEDLVAEEKSVTWQEESQKEGMGHEAGLFVPNNDATKT